MKYLLPLLFVGGAAVAQPLAAPGFAALLAGAWRLDVTCTDGHRTTGEVNFTNVEVDDGAARAEGTVSGLETYDGDRALAWSYDGDGETVHMELYREVARSDRARRCTPGEAAENRCLIDSHQSIELIVSGPASLRGGYDRWRWWGAAECDVTAVRIR
jgi:hypothetical protein